MPGSTFRCQCKLCSDIFFGPTKDTPYCNRCAKRVGYRPPKPQKPAPVESTKAAETAPEQPAATPASAAAAPTPHPPPAPDPVPAASAGGPPAEPATAPRPKPDGDSRRGEGNRQGTAPARTPAPKPASKAAAERPTAAPAAGTGGEAKISDSLRNSIEHAYAYYAEEPDIALKDIIDKICLEFGLERRVVHEIVAPVHTSRLRQQSTQLTPQQRKEIGDRYHEMVLTGARPSGGRRKQIARELNLPANAVVTVVAQWAWNHHDPRELSREQKFQIEKSYWRQIHPEEATSGESGARSKIGEITHKVAAELGLPTFAVARWVDQLHDDPRPMDRVPSLAPETAADIEAAYREYIGGDAPPADSLHRTLAERFGCTLRQAHRTLLLYRWRERLDRVDGSAEEATMVQESAARALTMGANGAGTGISETVEEEHGNGGIPAEKES